MKTIIKGFLVTLFAIGATNVHGAQKAATKQLKKATALIASNPNQAKKLIATALRNIVKVKGSAQQQLQAQAQKLQAQLLAKPIVKPVVKPTAKPVFKPAKIKPPVFAPKPAQQQEEGSTTTPPVSPPLVSKPVSVAALPSSSSVPPSISSTDPPVVRPQPAYAHTIENLSPIVKKQERASCGFHAAKNAKYILEWLNARDIIDSARNQNLINQATKTQDMKLITDNRNTWLATSGPDLGQCKLTDLNLDEIKDRAKRLAINPQQFNIIQDMSLEGYKNREEEIYKLADFIEKIEKGQPTFHAFIVGSMRMIGERGTYGHWIAIVVDFNPDTGVTYYVADSLGGGVPGLMIEALKRILNRDPLKLRNEMQLLVSNIPTLLSTANILMMEQGKSASALGQINVAINAIEGHNLPLTEELHIILTQITVLLEIIDNIEDKELSEDVRSVRVNLEGITKKLRSPQQQVAPAVQVVRPPVSRQQLDEMINQTRANLKRGVERQVEEQGETEEREKAAQRQQIEELLAAGLTKKDIQQQIKALEDFERIQQEQQFPEMSEEELKLQKEALESYQ